MLCLFESSPPSPELDLAPNSFIASASVSCATGDNAPRLIPAESKRFSIFLVDSTLLKSMGFKLDLILRLSLKDEDGRLFT